MEFLLINIQKCLSTWIIRIDGRQGEDITANLTIKDIKNSDKDFPKEIDIRGEVFIKNSDFRN